MSFLLLTHLIVARMMDLQLKKEEEEEEEKKILIILRKKIHLSRLVKIPQGTRKLLPLSEGIKINWSQSLLKYTRLAQVPFFI